MKAAIPVAIIVVIVAFLAISCSLTNCSLWPTASGVITDANEGIDLGDMGDISMRPDEMVGRNPAPIAEDCATVQNEFTRDLCYLLKAGDEYDPEICKNISTKAGRYDCVVPIALNIFDNLVIERNCDLLATETLRNNCSASIGSEAIIPCNTLEMQSLVYLCYSDVADEEVELSICEKISHDVFKQRCIDRVTSQLTA